MKTIALTGAYGYAGSCIRRQLERSGCAVKCVEGELTERRSRIDCDVLVHAAGATRGSRRGLLGANVDALACTLARLPDRSAVLYLSSRAVYAPAACAILGEDAALGPQDEYGRSKQTAEELLESTGRRTIVLRASALVGIDARGRSNESSALNRMIRSALLGDPIRCAGHHTAVDSLHVWDLAKAVTRLLERGDLQTRKFNVAGPTVKMVTLAQKIVCAVAERTGRNAAILIDQDDERSTLLDCGRLLREVDGIERTSCEALVPEILDAMLSCPRNIA